MIINAKISLYDYVGLMFVLTYRKTTTLIVSLIGVINLVLCAIYYAGKHIFDQPPYFQLVFGIIILSFIPISIYFSAKKMYYSSRLLQETITYELTKDKILMRGESFSAERDLDKTQRVEELNNWFLVYESEKTANLIPKKSMTATEIDQFRTIFANLPAFQH